MGIDVVIVGGGPAGLSAALVLGRARKRVVVLDEGTPRNAASPAMHGFLGHDGIAPPELRRVAREQLAAYDTIEIRGGRAVSLERGPMGRVRVELAEGAPLEARRVLLASGLVDLLPKIPGTKELWGRSIFSCPYCHGYELRDRTWGVLAVNKAVLGSVPFARTWARDVVLFTNGRTDLDPASLEALARRGVRVEPRKIVSLIGERGELVGVEVEGSERVACGAMWLSPGRRHVDLVLYAGLALDEEGLVRIDEQHQTSMRGVHACGDMAGGAHPHAIQAAADGARAAMDLVDLSSIDEPLP